MDHVDGLFDDVEERAEGMTLWWDGQKSKKKTRGAALLLLQFTTLSKSLVPATEGRRLIRRGSLLDDDGGARACIGKMSFIKVQIRSSSRVM